MDEVWGWCRITLSETKGWKVKTGQCSSVGSTEGWLRERELTSGWEVGTLWDTCHTHTQILQSTFAHGRGGGGFRITPLSSPQGLQHMCYLAFTFNQNSSPIISAYNQCVKFMWPKSKPCGFRSAHTHTRSSKVTPKREHTSLGHITVCLPGERTITSWFWQSFAAGVTKETVHRVVSGAEGPCLLGKQHREG